VIADAPPDSLLGRFCMALDAADYPAVVECFTPQGTWIRLGKPLGGRVTILKELTDNRSKTVKTIHLVSNVCIDEQSDDRGAGRFYLVAYRRDTSDPPPYPVPLPTVIGICHMTVVRGRRAGCSSRWRLGRFCSLTERRFDRRAQAFCRTLKCRAASFAQAGLNRAPAGLLDLYVVALFAADRLPLRWDMP